MKTALIAKRIKITREALGLTQSQLARKIKTCQSMVVKLEAGTTDYRVSTLERISKLTDEPRETYAFLTGVDK